MYGKPGDALIGQPCVLVVEDDLAIRELCAMLLREDEGYKVETAVDGQDAIDHLGCAPDLILLDLMMPVMDGREFLRRLRTFPEHRVTPVLVMTAEGSGATITGAQGIVHKPFETAALLSEVEGLLAAPV